MAPLLHNCAQVSAKNDTLLRSIILILLVVFIFLLGGGRLSDPCRSVNETHFGCQH